MARAPTAEKRSPAQIAAGRKFAAAGRAAQRGRTRSAAQKQQSLRFLAAGRAAAIRKRQHKAPLPRKQRAAIAPVEYGLAGSGSFWLAGCNDLRPVCAAVAVANHMLATTGIAMADHEILALFAKAGGNGGGACISDVLEVLRSWHHGFRGGSIRLAHFSPTDEAVIISGLVVGLDTPHGSHAVVSHPYGMVSWGQVLSWAGNVEEAWALEWEVV